MVEESTLAVLCSEVQSGDLRYSFHYAQQMFKRPMPNRDQIRYILCDDNPEIIEHNAGDSDARGSSCLIWGIISEERIGHVLCSYPPNPVIITAYWPDTQPEKWTDDFFKERAVRR